VESVPPGEVERFLELTGLSLPSEAQWRGVCAPGGRGPVREADLGAVAWFAGNAQGETRPAGTRRANAYGLHDLLGNVAERTVEGTLLGGSYADPAPAVQCGAEPPDGRAMPDPRAGFRPFRALPPPPR